MVRITAVKPVVRVPSFKVLDFTQAAAVQNTWYTAFEGAHVDFDLLGVGITVADETVEIRVTIDGEVLTSLNGVDLTFAANMVAAVVILRTFNLTTGYLGFEAATTSLLTNAQTYGRWLRGKAVKIEVRKTTAGGASALRCIGYYHQY